MSLQSKTAAIDGILCTVVAIISGILWVLAGFPYLWQVISFVCLVITCLLFFRAADKNQG
jgi:hypothetical protein